MKLLEVYYEHVKNEMVDFDKVDLVYEYNKLNDHIFNGELPLAVSSVGDSATNSVQIRWNSGKNAHGRTSYSYKADPNSGKIWTGKGWQTTGYKVVPGSIKVTMSKFLDVPYHVFLDTLAHEMIHVYQVCNGVFKEPNGNHGQVFHQQMDRINGMNLGFKVNVELDTNALGLKVHSNIKAKPAIAIIFTFNNTKRGLSVFTPNAYHNQRDRIDSIFNYNTGKNNKYAIVTGEVYETQIHDLLQMKHQKSLNSLSTSVVPDDLLTKVATEGKLIAKFVSEKGETHWS